MVKAKVSFKRGREVNFFVKRFQYLNLQKGFETPPQKRQLLAYAAIKVEKYMVRNLYCSCIQFSALLIC